MRMGEGGKELALRGAVQVEAGMNLVFQEDRKPGRLNSSKGEECDMTIINFCTNRGEKLRRFEEFFEK